MLQNKKASGGFSAIQFAKSLLDKYRSSKNKTRIILSAIFITLMIWGIFSMIAHYISGINLRSGFLEVSGRIEGYEYHAGTKASGRVAEMFVAEGDRVKVGQPIGKIYSRQIEAALEDARARLELAEKEYNHYKALAHKDAVAKIKFDEADQNFKVARENFNRAEADLEDTLVVAPTDGTVVTQIVWPGEVISAGTPLVTIINMDDLFLNIFLATDVAGKVAIGNEVLIFPDSIPDDSFEAYVNKIGEKAEFTPKNVETKSQRAKLVFQIKAKIKDNKGHALKPGMPSSSVIRIKNDVPWTKYKR